MTTHEHHLEVLISIPLPKLPDGTPDYTAHALAHKAAETPAKNVLKALEKLGFHGGRQTRKISVHEPVHAAAGE